MNNYNQFKTTVLQPPIESKGYVSEDIPEVAIAIEPRYRGKGVGSILLNKSLELARTLGTPGLSLSVDDGNPRAKKLYERLGFQHIRHSDAGFSIMCYRF
ncbi:N-acetyltransferase [Corynebacterium diphtheriae]|nr:N-acetyltransferase [Corynebacterium diphtheriae]